MSLNKGSLDKANQNQKLDIEYLYADFIAGENIAAGQILMVSTAANDTVLIGTSSGRSRIVGVALHSALITETVKVCILGIIDIVAGENITRGDIISLGATAGRGYKGTTETIGAGSAHTHAETLGMGVPSGTLNNVPHNCGISFLYAASSSGGACTTSFYALDAAALVSAADSTHNHTISGAITAESAHTHDYNPGRILGKALESFTAGNSGKILVCLA